MRTAWFVGGLSLLLFSTGCCCGSCGGGSWGRSAPPTTYTPTAQYGVPGDTYASGPAASGTESATMPSSSVATAPGASTSLSSTNETVTR